RTLLARVGDKPLIVRSSSLLEDNFGTSFAGKYESIFCPNQGTPEENLHALTRAIARVFASGLNPDALLYRRAMGLQDYDERLAILIQVVEGERFGDYYFPHAAGVAFSRNMFRWSPQIRQEDGFLRLVWGLGTRAVERVGNDYPRLVALSHPLLRPEYSTKLIRRYSQRYVDVINLAENRFETLPIHRVLNRRYPLLRYIAQIDQGGFLLPIRTNLSAQQMNSVVLTFDGLLQRTSFAAYMRIILSLLEKHYQTPVDMEFAVYLDDPHDLHPDVRIAILQCRPQSHSEEEETHLPEDMAAEDIVFSTRGMIPRGRVRGIRYVVFVSPEGYYALPTASDRAELGRAIGRLNTLLADETFICIGPGRWGTRNPDLGVNIRYSEIYNTRALIELAGGGFDGAPEPSFGTHFFQDLVEARIYPLAIDLDDAQTVFKREFFYQSPNRLAELSPADADLESCLRVIDVAAYRPGHVLELIMDGTAGQAVALLVPES
ncbi:MAG: pyruvate, phosphate dikinase, partial [Anaerolineae bacterium]